MNYLDEECVDKQCLDKELVNEYINIKEFEGLVTHIGKSDTEVSVYQIQPLKNTSYAIIKEVGKFEESLDILINTFEISTREKNIIVSIAMSKKDLVYIENKFRFPIFKLTTNYNNGQRLKPVSAMFFNFHTFEHHQSNIDGDSICNYLTNKDAVDKKLNGYYSISFHFNENKIILEKFKTCDNTILMIDKMIEYLASDKIREIVNKLLYKN
jgi:hypothetical protein